MGPYSEWQVLVVVVGAMLLPVGAALGISLALMKWDDAVPDDHEEVCCR